MKKIIYVGAICLIALLVLTGCGNETTNSTNNPANAVENTASNYTDITDNTVNSDSTTIQQEIYIEGNKIIQKQPQPDGGQVRLEYTFNASNKLETMKAIYEAQTEAAATVYSETMKENSEGLYENIVKNGKTVTADATSEVITMYQALDKDTLLNVLKTQYNND